MDKVSYVQGLTQALVIICCTRFNCLSEQGVGGLEGHIGLPALLPVPYLSGFCVYRELCHSVQCTYPIVLLLISSL